MPELPYSYNEPIESKNRAKAAQPLSTFSA